MKHILCFLFFILFSISLFGQTNLGAERIQRLRNSVVRILIEGRPMGTGFFINKKGEVVTCWHVVFPGMVYDSITRQMLLKKLEIEMWDGKRYEYGIVKDYWDTEAGIRGSVLFDYCLLGSLPRKISPKNFAVLQIGNFSNVEEGDAVYSCGYPLGIAQQFVSTGILSTKWKDVGYFNGDSTRRDVAWLDLTMNRGNSGGPIIKFGKKPEDDKVIGIATFILNPSAHYSEALIEHLGKNSSQFSIGGVNQFDIQANFAKAIANNSIGVSGCISIDHFKITIKVE